MEIVANAPDSSGSVSLLQKPLASKILQLPVEAYEALDFSDEPRFSS